MEKEQHGSELHRAMGVAALTVYAVGDVLGAGIYALVGKVASEAGGGAWASFLVAAFIASFTGLTFAELGSRYPVAAGAVAYVKRGFDSRVLAFVIGFVVMASGLTSAAAVSHAFVGYLDTFVRVPELAGSVALLALMSWVSYRGMRESSALNMVLTAVELSGLLLISFVGLAHARGLSLSELELRLSPDLGGAGVLGGASVAFYAYVGFEDTASVAEEVKHPERALPRAILTALVVSTLLYLAVSLAALLTVPRDELARSGAPLLAVLDAAGVPVPRSAFSLVALFAICNTGLLNLIMASRLAYGMAREGLLPAAVGRVHVSRKTPHVAVALTFVLALILAVSGGVKFLAQFTALLLLIVFATMHVSLLSVKRRFGHAIAGAFTAPRWVPVLGLVLCVFLMLQFSARLYWGAGAVLLSAMLAYVLVGRRRGV